MHFDLLAAAVPIFFVAIAAEIAIDRVRRTGSYRFGTAIADLLAGVVSRVGDVFLRGIGVAAYAWVYQYRWFEFPEGSALSWVIGLFGIDLLYYWWHRLSHVVNVMWAVHAVHHQSEDFNLAVALRQPAFEALSIIPLHLPLALFGVSPWIYATSYAINLIYQFFIHTEIPGRLGFVEWVFNTPSAHRVHHGIDPIYLDRNYGGVLVIWDRLFRSYQREESPPVYGVTHALRSYNPIWANVAPFRDLALRARKERSLVRRLGIWFAHPASLYDPVPDRAPITRASRKKYDPRSPRNVSGYVFAHFALLTLAGGAFMAASEGAQLDALIAPGVLLLGSTAALSGWVEGHRWALAVDLARQGGTVAFVAFLVSERFPRVGLLSAGALALIFVLVFAVFRPHTGRGPPPSR